jgi:ribosomal silencing factor RsfS
MKINDLKKLSNPEIVFEKFRKYKGNDNATIEISNKPDKKYKVIYNGRSTHFGSTMEDYTKHGNKARRDAYLARSGGIKGNWKMNKYSANQLSRNLLW